MPASPLPKPDPASLLRISLLDVRRWAEVCEVQIDRINTWLGEILDGGRDPRSRTADDFRFHVTGEADRHFLLIAANHLLTSLRRVRKAAGVVAVSGDITHAVEVTRDVLEHWDQHRVAFEDPSRNAIRAAGKYKADWPDIDPWSFRWDDVDGAFVGPLSLVQFVQELGLLKDELRRLGALPNS